MTKTERKHTAQDLILSALGTAYYSVADNEVLDEASKDALFAALDVQRNRVERLFGFEPSPNRPW